jgi:hypothetical protein
MGKIVAGIVLGALVGVALAVPFIVYAYGEDPQHLGYEARWLFFSGICSGALVGAVAGAALLLKRTIEDQPGWPPEKRSPGEGGSQF